MLYTLDNKPARLETYRKKSKAEAIFITEPFEVETQEGRVTIGPDTVDGWDGGYWLVYPDDGSKPYTWAPSFKDKNMEMVAA
jgi:hypothetical protein